MSWNHRVFAYESQTGEVYLEVHETYYDKKGIPNGYADQGNVMRGDSIKGLNWTANKIKLALKKPILSAENFPKEYKPRVVKKTVKKKSK